MTTDERIERLTERHEALVMAVELTSGEIKELKNIAAQSLESVNRLLRIAEIHERRISHLEGYES